MEETSSENIERGRIGDNRIVSYHCRLFFDLERQRVEHQNEIRKSLRDSVSSKPFFFTKWCRIVTSKYMNDPLSSLGSVSSFGGRFNYGKHINFSQFQSFNALYIAETEGVARYETFGISADPSSQLSTEQMALAPRSHHFVRLKGKIHSIIDI